MIFGRQSHVSEGYSSDFHNKNNKERVMNSTHCRSDPIYFPFREAVEEQIETLSGAGCLKVSSIIAANVKFIDSDFAVSIVAYQEDFEDSSNTLLAPPVQREPPNGYVDNYFPNR